MTATIAFLGTGSMNGSIAAGLLAAGHDPAHIRATVRSEESRAALAQHLGDKVESSPPAAKQTVTTKQPPTQTSYCSV